MKALKPDIPPGYPAARSDGGVPELRNVPYPASDQGYTYVHVHRLGEITVIEVFDGGPEAIEAVQHAVLVSLAEPCRAIVVNLSPLAGSAASVQVSGLGGLGALAGKWPGIPIAVACPRVRVRASLQRLPMAEHLVVTASLQEAVTIVTRRFEPLSAVLYLAPHPTAARAARTFVGRTLLDWGLRRGIASNCLVVSELVTNAMLHARTDLQLWLAQADNALRIAVRDGSSNVPLAPGAHPDRAAGRGLLIVEGLARSWGVLPTDDGGKVVWAVTDL